MCLSVTVRPQATNVYTTYRHYLHLPSLTRRDGRGGAYRRSLACRETVLQGPLYCDIYTVYIYIYIRYAVLQTAVNIVYWLATTDKPNVSHSFVSKSDRKQAAGRHLVPLSSLSRALG